MSVADPFARSGVTFSDAWTGKPVGTVDTTVHPLEQAEWWRTRGGDLLSVADMDLGHVRRLVRYLERHAWRFHWGACMRMSEAMAGPLGPSGDMATMAADSEYDAMCGEPPVTWLHGMPLVKALDARLAEAMGAA